MGKPRTDKKAFLFYETFLDELSSMGKDEKFKWYEIIANYGCKGVVPQLNSAIEKSFFMHIKYAIDTSYGNYLKAIENGKKGGRKPLFTPEQETEIVTLIENNQKTVKELAMDFQCSEQTIYNVLERIEEVKKSKNLNKNTNTNKNENKNKNKNDNISISTSMQQNKFVANEIPTPQQVHDFYIKNEDLKMLPYEFYNYCERNNWYANNEPVYDWRKCYKSLNDMNNDYQYDNVYHDTQLIFNSSDYVIL